MAYPLRQKSCWQLDETFMRYGGGANRYIFNGGRDIWRSEHVHNFQYIQMRLQTALEGLADWTMRLNDAVSTTEIIQCYQHNEVVIPWAERRSPNSRRNGNSVIRYIGSRHVCPKIKFTTTNLGSKRTKPLPRTNSLKTVVELLLALQNRKCNHM